MAEPTEQPVHTDPTTETWSRRARRLLGPLITALRDVQFRQAVAARMLSAVYVVLLSGLAVFCVATVSDAFAQSLWLGVIYLLIVAPAYFVVGTVVARVLLETIRAIIQIADDLHRMANTHDRMAGMRPLRGLLSNGEPSSETRDD